MQRQYAIFYLGGMAVGLDVLIVREVNALSDFTVVSPAPDFIMGLLNLRGQIVCLIDLSVRLQFPRNEDSKERWCVVLKTAAELQALNQAGAGFAAAASDSAGLVMDGIGDIVSIDESQIGPPPPNLNGIEGSYLSGIAQLENQLVALLKLDEILRYSPQQKNVTIT